MNALSDLQLRVNHTLKEKAAKEQLKAEKAEAKKVDTTRESEKVVSDAPPEVVVPRRPSEQILGLIKKAMTSISSLFNKFIKK
jgi:hypothetical protein